MNQELFRAYQRELAKQRERILKERENMTSSSLFEEDKNRVILTDTYLSVTSQERKELKEDWGKLCPNVDYKEGFDESLKEINDMFNDTPFSVSEPPKRMPQFKEYEPKNKKSEPLF